MAELSKDRKIADAVGLGSKHEEAYRPLRAYTAVVNKAVRNTWDVVEIATTPTGANWKKIQEAMIKSDAMALIAMKTHAFLAEELER